ncbi:MAG: DUF992 domain-containing protein [Xanthobacteraceae bacterium]|nr:MAG: DUF992 domain-containing protein [Xanthobacteraceae bacterium]
MRRLIAVTILILTSFGLFAPDARAQSYVQAGILECRGGPSVGMVLGSVVTLGCSLRNMRGVTIDHYVAVARRIGLDIGITNDTSLLWAVYAPVRRIGRGDLSGEYAGASGSITIGVGGGANALVGGSANSFALQPLSVQGQTGINLAVGVASLELRPGRPVR